MSSGTKFSISLLVSVILFAAFSVFTFSGYFDLVEAKFYQPAVKKPVEQKINNLSELEKQYTEILVSRFMAFAQDESVQSYTQSKASESNVKARTIAGGKLFSSSPYLTGIRIIDKNGRKIHYSTFESDKKKQDNSKVVYEDYRNLVSAGEISFAELICSEQEKYKIKTDGKAKRTVFSMPYTGKSDSGTLEAGGIMVFYCENSDFARFACSKNLLTISEKDSGEYVYLPDNSSGGFIFGLPVRNLEISKEAVDSIKNAVLEKVFTAKSALAVDSSKIYEDSFTLRGSYVLLDESNKKEEQVEAEIENEYSTAANNISENSLLSTAYNWIIFTKWNEDNSFISYLYPAEMFEVTFAMRILLLVLIFITLFLIIFLILNLKRDDMIVIQDRIKRFQLEFITEYVKGAENRSLKGLPSDINSGKEKLNQDIRKSLGHRGKKHSQEVDELLEKNWKEIFSALGVQEKPALSGVKASIDSEELRSILEEILGSGKLKIAAASVETVKTPSAVKTSPAVNSVAADEMEELDEVEELTDEPEELDEVEELVDEPEELDEVEELADEPEELAEVEELADEPEELDEVEELADESEELAEVEELTDEPEELDEVEELVDEPEELAEVEELDDEPEELAEVEELADEPEELAEVEELVDEPEELDEVEELADEPEELDEVEELTDEPEEIVDDFTEIQNYIDENAANEKQKAEEIEIEDEPMIFSSPMAGNRTEIQSDISIDDFSVEKMDFTFLDDEIQEESDDETIYAQEFEDSSYETLSLRERSEEARMKDRVETYFDVSDSDVEGIAYKDTTENENIFSHGTVDLTDIFGGEEKTENPDNGQNLYEEEYTLTDEESLKQFSEDELNLKDESVSKDENIDLEAVDINDFLSDEENQSEAEDAEEAEIVESVEEVEEAEIAEPAEDAEPVEILGKGQYQNPFMFTSFGANNNNITDLSPDNSDAIVAGNDGIFHIEGAPSANDVKLDDDFKKLVESVLN